jgi:hypothetical protein
MVLDGESAAAGSYIAGRGRGEAASRVRSVALRGDEAWEFGRVVRDGLGAAK